MLGSKTGRCKHSIFWVVPILTLFSGKCFEKFHVIFSIFFNQVGGHEIYCHRVVVGVASVAIYDELCLGEQESGPIARIPIDASKSVLSPVAVEILIDYMYTSRYTVFRYHYLLFYALVRYDYLFLQTHTVL